MTDDARARVRAMAGRGFDEAGRRWLVSPAGLLAACREAVAHDDLRFFDEFVAGSLPAQLDDESLQAAGLRPSERAAGLVCAGRLARWCMKGGDDPEGPRAWLELEVRGFSAPSDPLGPARPQWTAPVGLLDGASSAVADADARAAALIAVAHRSAAHPGLLTVGDLVHYLLAVRVQPEPWDRISVPILTSRHREGELVHLAVVARPGPPGIALNAVVGPFTRADATFAAAMEAAWDATRAPSLGARWSVISDRTGAALDVIEGRSAGAGAAVALHYLSRRGSARLDPTWAITGAIDPSGSLTSLLDDDHNIATYRTKLVAAGDRTVVVPTSDHPHVVGLVESGAVKASLRPAASVAEIIDMAPPLKDPPPRRTWVVGVGVALLVALAYAVFTTWPDSERPPPGPVPAVAGLIYSVGDNGDLRWYRDARPQDGGGGFSPGSGKALKDDFRFPTVFSAGGGVFYAIDADGKMYWYRHLDPEGGGRRFANGGRGTEIGVGWDPDYRVFSGGGGIIYTIDPAGAMYWYRHFDPAGGAGGFAN